MGDMDTKFLSELAVSLNLNLAACALKLLKHKAARDLCSLVLSSFPLNVKALFRRALALMKLNLFSEAQFDLEKALLVEPKNKEILRELDVVEYHLCKNMNGKRSLEESLKAPTMKGVIREGNKTINGGQQSEKTMMDYNKNVVADHDLLRGECSFSLSAGHDVCLTDGSSIQPTISDNVGLEVDTKVESCHDNLKAIEFTKKGDHNSQLRITMDTYQKLLNGLFGDMELEIKFGIGPISMFGKH